jgi:hypothetical protein
MLQRFLQAINIDDDDAPPAARAEAGPVRPVPFRILFDGEHVAPPEPPAVAAAVNAAVAVRTPRRANPVIVTDGLRLPTPRPSLAIMGGAGQMSQEAQAQVRAIVFDGLSRFAAEHALNVVDGGTDAGAMALMGQARAAHHAAFPLIGVAPNALVRYPGFENPHAEAALEANHSHFALTTGSAWGDESDLLAGLAYAASGGDAPTHFPTLGVVLNGGAVVRREAHARACGVLRFPLLVLEGSGRFADELAAAWRAKGSDDPAIAEILREGEIAVVPIARGPAYLNGWLREFFGL